MTSGAGVRPADARGVSARRGRPRRVDWAVAIVAVLLQLLAPQTGSPTAGPRSSWVGALATVLALGQGVPLAWRRVYGYWVAGVVLGCYGGYVVAVGVVPPFAGWVVIWSLAIVVAERRRATLAALAAAGVTCAFIVVGELVRSTSEPSALLSLVTVIVALAAVPSSPWSVFSPMVDREGIIAAQNAWRDAEKAYQDETAKYDAWWLDGGPTPGAEPEPLTREALVVLARLREVAQSALVVYRDVLGE
jgi:hypothetical protein